MDKREGSGRAIRSGMSRGVRGGGISLNKYIPISPRSKPVIAGINWPGVGLGLVIALYCDLRFGIGWGSIRAQRCPHVD